MCLVLLLGIFSLFDLLDNLQMSVCDQSLDCQVLLYQFLHCPDESLLLHMPWLPLLALLWNKSKRKFPQGTRIHNQLPTGQGVYEVSQVFSYPCDQTSYTPDLYNAWLPTLYNTLSVVIFTFKIHVNKHSIPAKDQCEWFVGLHIYGIVGAKLVTVAWRVDSIITPKDQVTTTLLGICNVLYLALFSLPHVIENGLDCMLSMIREGWLGDAYATPRFCSMCKASTQLMPLL